MISSLTLDMIDLCNRRRDVLLHELREWHRLMTLVVGSGHHAGLSVRNVAQNEGIVVRIVRVTLLQRPNPFSGDIGREF